MPTCHLPNTCGRVVGGKTIALARAPPLAVVVVAASSVAGVGAGAAAAAAATATAAGDASAISTSLHLEPPSPILRHDRTTIVQHAQWRLQQTQCAIDRRIIPSQTATINNEQ